MARTFFVTVALLAALIGFGSWAGLGNVTGFSQPAAAQEFIFRGNSARIPTIDEYMESAGPQTEKIPHGAMKIDGQPVYCGTRPTVLDSEFDSWGGALPGFLIMNTLKIGGLPTQVKLYIYYHECGHQFANVGANETKADLFSIRRGVKRGWLDAQGMEEICTFISKLKGDAVHPPGPKRCATMRAYYQELVTGTQQARTSQKKKGFPFFTLGPSN